MTFQRTKNKIVVLSIYEELHVPVKWIGLGEREDDLERFNAKDFAKALFETTDHASGESTKGITGQIRPALDFQRVFILLLI